MNNENQTMFEIWKEMHPDYPLPAKEFLMELIGDRKRTVHIAIINKENREECVGFDFRLPYAEKISLSELKDKIIDKNPEYILGKTYCIPFSVLGLQTIGFNFSRIDHRLETLSAYINPKYKNDFNACIVEDKVFICECDKIKFKEIRYSDDGEITTENSVEESDSDSDGTIMDCISPSYDDIADRTRVKTKSQYRLESVTVDNYTETGTRYDKYNNIYKFIRNSKIEITADRVYEVKFKYVKEKPVKIFVDKKLVQEVEIIPNRTTTVDLKRHHYNLKTKISKISYNTKILRAKFVAKQMDMDAQLSVTVLKDTDDSKDREIYLMTTKIPSWDVALS